jgi:hypothetical protein
MKQLLLATVAAVALIIPAKADVILDTTGLGGTGNNVVFSQIASSSLVLGHLNGQNNEVVRFRDLSPSPNPLLPFSGSQSGNDIKIVNTNDLDITVFDAANLVQLGTTRDIFSLKGSGSVFIRVDAVDALGNAETFNFGSLTLAAFQLSASAQQGFDFTASNGEVIKDIDVFLVGLNANITDFEHFRIDAAPIPTAAVPELSTWLMMILGFAGVGLVGMRKRREHGFRFV